MDIKEKITVKDILKDNYNNFKYKYWNKVPQQIREHIDNAVTKALKCSNDKYGFAEYKCAKCGERTKLPFTCKSKFCNRYCNANFYYLGESKIKEGSYFVDEDEPMHFDTHSPR